MTWKRAQRPLGFAAASGSFVFLAMMVVLVQSGDRGTRTPGRTVLFLLSMSGAALLGAASIKLLHETRHGIHRRRLEPAGDTYQRKLQHEFYDWLILFLSDGFPTLHETEVALDADMAWVTSGRIEQFTLADLTNFAIRHLAGVGHEDRRPRPAFYRVREALERTLEVPRKKIRPSARLEQLFPKSRRAESWEAFLQDLKLPTPPLELPYRFKWIAVLALLPFLCVASVGFDRGPAFLAYIGGAGFVGVLWGFRRAMERLGFATAIPSAYVTAGDFARHLAHRGPYVRVPWTEEQLKERIEQMVGWASGLRITELRGDARLTDLGIRLVRAPVTQSRSAPHRSQIQ